MTSLRAQRSCNSTPAVVTVSGQVVPAGCNVLPALGFFRVDDATRGPLDIK
jgi:hypothetical protein